MPKAIRGEKKTPPVMLSHDSPLLVEGAFPPKRNDVLLPRVYLKTPDAPGQRAFSRRAASFFLEIRQYSCEKMSCAARKFLAAGHIGSFQIHPSHLTRSDYAPHAIWMMAVRRHFTDTQHHVGADDAVRQLPAAADAFPWWKVAQRAG